MKNLSGDKKANRLLKESSPYLQQHAYNPVDWYPWGEEALKKAKNEDKLIIVSIGYAACHWCHVMEHESFEDSLVANIMNENFVSIKVDREERPDIDDVYMTAAQLLNGRGGWPLNAIALPDGKPVFAGTYYPKDQWVNILNQISKVKNEDPDRLRNSAEKITEGIQSTALIEVNTNDLSISKETFTDHINSSLETFDPEYGGRLGAPKFPMPNTYQLLMKQYWINKDPQILNTIKTGLDNMANGGIYDQLGGGFARYSVDQFWLVPHFEKMLYDNGQLVSIYSEAYKLLKKPLYKNKITQTLAFIERELMSPEFGFYSSLDADSEGEEGKFYVWQYEEIERIIKDENKFKIFTKFYDVSQSGNWEHTNILNVKKESKKFAKENNINEEALADILSECEIALMAERDKRIRPGLDNKILTSWNALMLMGYIDAYDALGESHYLEMALKNAQFLIDNQMQEDGRLNRNYMNGQSSINAFLDDYSLLANAFMKLYETTFDISWLERSEKLIKYSIEHFYNNETKMFNYTSNLDPKLIARKSEFEDNVIPSSNSLMARALFKMGTLKYNKEYLNMSEQMLKNMSDKILSTNYISFYSNWIQLLYDFTYPPFEIAILGEDALDKRNEMANNYHGNSIWLGSTDEENLELLKDKMQDETYIYVCQNKTCKLPVNSAKEAELLIKH